MARPKNRPNHTADEKAFALAALTMRRAVNPDVPLRRVAAELNINRHTLSAWDKGEFICDEIRQKIEDKKKTLADYHDLVGNIALVRLTERLVDDDKAEEILARDLSKISVEQRSIARLDRGEATSITGTVDSEARAKAMALLEKYIELLGDRDAALARLQEKAPTIAKWVV